MSRSIAALVVTAGLVAFPVAAQQAVSAQGIWTVTAVRSDPDLMVSALLDDDPAYMGATLTVSSGAITWAKGRSSGAGTFGDCARPAFVQSSATPGSLDVTCGGAPWGPDASLRPLAHDRLELAWYDGGLLTLTRR